MLSNSQSFTKIFYQPSWQSNPHNMVSNVAAYVYVCVHYFLKNPNHIKKSNEKTLLKIFFTNSIFSTNRKKITVYLFINWNLKFTSSESYIFVKIILISSTIKCSEIANENYPLPIHDVHTRSHQKCRENHKDGHPLQPEILIQRKKHTF